MDFLTFHLQKMTEKLEEILTFCGFIDDYEEFLNANLDHETIFYLSDAQLEKIFEGNLGKVIKFKIQISKYIEEKVCKKLFVKQ